MLISNHKRIGLALELLKMGIAPYIGREIKSAIKKGQISHYVIHEYVENRALLKTEIQQWDLAPLLKLMDDTWNVVFQDTLGFSEHSILGELRDWHAKWEHQSSFSNDDTDRVLDSVVRFLNSINATDVAADAMRMKKDFRRFIFQEQVRQEERSLEVNEHHELIETSATETLKPWRDVITPHPDVASGQYLQAEFAADLWQVHLGEASDGYRDPVEFFKRTYLTGSLKDMLVSAIKRISGIKSDPVVQLQTNFGGGKTHSLLTLYHLFSGANTDDMPGVNTLIKMAGLYTLPGVRRVVLVGNKISPDSPSVKPNGLTIRTLWGELAYQLGGKKAFEKIRDHDKKRTSPGKKLFDLLNDHGPCVILVDEWVAYARQLRDKNDLAGGTFDTQFAFARDLIEAAEKTRNCLLVVALPASEASDPGEAKADDIEVGGAHGIEALARFEEVLDKVDTSWRPATAKEDFEIVRSRLFEPVSADRDKFIKMTSMAFTELYIQKLNEFPAETQTSHYKKRIQTAYPIHPEIFDRLYNDWSSLVLFQGTRGVLRLMATVIHSLWEKGDRNPLILPSTIPIEDSRVQSELTRYLPDEWPEVIRQDVDGEESAARRIDNEHPHLGELNAARRVARTIYLGSSPLAKRAEHGIEDIRVLLGCVMPGESAAIFNDAQHRLAESSTFLNHDGSRYWYATRPAITKIAKDRAEQLASEPEKIFYELRKRLPLYVHTDDAFAGIHVAAESGSDITDDMSNRLVVLDPAHTFSQDTDNSAVLAARKILEFNGESPRKYQNTLVFLAADKEAIRELDEAIRNYLAWTSILKEKKEFELDATQRQQVEEQCKSAERAMSASVAKTYRWLLVPTKDKAEGDLMWKVNALDRADCLAEAAAKSLILNERLLTAMHPLVLRMHLDRVPLWRDDHVSVQHLLEAFSKYICLPRLVAPELLIQAVNDGVASPDWEEEAFAFAEEYDESGKTFIGITAGESISIEQDTAGLLVRAEVASALLEALAKEEAEQKAGEAITDEPAPEEEAVAEETEEPPLEETVAEETEESSMEEAGSGETPVKDDASSMDEIHLTGEDFEPEEDTAGITASDRTEQEAEQKTEQDDEQEAEQDALPEPASESEIRLPLNGRTLSSSTEKSPKRFYGSITLNSHRAGYDAGKIAEEMIRHLVGEMGANVTVTLKIEAQLPEGTDEKLLRMVMENGRTLKFSSLELVNEKSSQNDTRETSVAGR